MILNVIQNKNFLLNVVYYLTISLFFIKCNIPKKLDNYPSTKIIFHELPDNVKSIFRDSYRNENLYYGKCISTNLNVECNMKIYTIDKDLFGLIFNGYNYVITINKKKYNLAANKQNPFVLSGNFLYYSEDFFQNISKLDSAIFISISLE